MYESHFVFASLVPSVFEFGELFKARYELKVDSGR